MARKVRRLHLDRSYVVVFGRRANERVTALRAFSLAGELIALCRCRDRRRAHGQTLRQVGSRAFVPVATAKVRGCGLSSRDVLSPV